ncbi:MAG TPA: Rieske (2Fe-2S) protein [Actinocrinis sp.]|nr:Rieske (2Fe-2S) protein [Actinocrinis sp.]
MDHVLTEPAETAAACPQPGAAPAEGACCGSSRRALLRAVGVGGAAAAVGLTAAACTTASATSSPAGAGAPSANLAPTGNSDLGPSSAVPVGGGMIYQEAKVVVTQPEAGTFKAFSAVCTHQGCTVATVSDNVITCACHGSEYSAVDGSVERGPATQALPAATVTVADGQITLG